MNISLQKNGEKIRLAENVIMINKLLYKINEEILIKSKSTDKIGLFVGLGGISLFQFYYSRYRNRPSQIKYAMENLERAMEIINGGYINPTYSSGVCGFLGKLVCPLSQGYAKFQKTKRGL